MIIIVGAYIVYACILVFYGSAAAIAASWIFKNRREIRFSQWLGIIAAMAFWPISLTMVVAFTLTDMSIEMDDKTWRKS